jgi:carbamoyltransferase
LNKWNEKTGVPIILNTSFNDREPICENVEHSIKCFLGTNIDYLFFPEYSLILKRK